MVASFFILWTTLVAVAICLLSVRDGAGTIFTELVVDVIDRPIWAAILMTIVLYFYLPFTIPNAIKEIREENEENGEPN